MPKMILPAAGFTRAMKDRNEVNREKFHIISAMRTNLLGQAVKIINGWMDDQLCLKHVEI